MAGKISGTISVSRGCNNVESFFSSSYSKSVRHHGSHHRMHKNQLTLLRKGHFLRNVPSSLLYCSWCISKKSFSWFQRVEHIVTCHSTSTCCRDDKTCSTKECCSNVYSCQIEDQKDGHDSQFCEQVLPQRIYHSNQGLAKVCKFVYNDAKFVNERAQSDIILLSRGLTRLNDRARQDVGVLETGFLRLDARAREDTKKIDNHMRKKAAHLRNIVTIIKVKAQCKLKNIADQHWSDGALESFPTIGTVFTSTDSEADLKRADSVARRRAMEDAFIALKFVKKIHDMMSNKLHRQPQKEGMFSINDMGFITLKRNGVTLDLLGGEIYSDRIIAIQESYQSMTSALSEADGIDYTDPEELELLVATLIDLDAMDSKSSVSLLMECSSSPDVSTRKALANALASAPSAWILGNVGMGALQIEEGCRGRAFAVRKRTPDGDHAVRLLRKVSIAELTS
ncbi:hypothetical protein KSP40_PGU004114 [Platanthera guangdongensis]|uniref:Uncharacterized protein n=1 Tax=Platanthera guangdongensis TaxID=2320717 RepID=A0ABR2MRP9_9ASPA